MIAWKESPTQISEPTTSQEPPPRGQETYLLSKSRHGRLRRHVHAGLELGVRRDTSYSLPVPGRHQSAEAKPKRLQVHNTGTRWDCGATQEGTRTMPPHKTERRGPRGKMARLCTQHGAVLTVHTSCSLCTVLCAL